MGLFAILNVASGDLIIKQTPARRRSVRLCLTKRCRLIACRRAKTSHAQAKHQESPQWAKTGRPTTPASSIKMVWPITRPPEPRCGLPLTETLFRRSF